MAFSPVPTESKSKINKAGQILAKGDPTTINLQSARDLAGKWRACHAYPINTFQSTLRKRIKKFPENKQKDIIVAQRLKRMPTIINKLKRFPAMQLTTMQDIGGIRAVLGSIDDVNRLADWYRKRPFEHELIDEKNYIQNPRDEDGYRSLHLIYKYKNKRNPYYDGLRIELQIRTKLQHTWATAVETMGTFLGQALKSRQGDKKWIEFFAIASSAFAYKENSISVPRYKDLSCEETFLAVAHAEADLQALNKMKGFSVAVEEIGKSLSSEKRWSYHLIILNSLQKTVKITAYDRNSFKKAMADYSKFETEAAQGAEIEPVLVSAGPIDMLRRAYPNFFLDIRDFVNVVNEIVSSTKENNP